MTDWQKFLKTNQERFEGELLDFVSIPSVSASSEYVEDVERAARWVSNRLEKAGAENTVIMPTGGHPVVYGDWLHAGKSKPTILIYGHFDVQPAEPFDLWDTPPFKPEIRNGKVYGRGASDDKGGMLIPIISFEAIKKTLFLGGPPQFDKVLTKRVKFLIWVRGYLCYRPEIRKFAGILKSWSALQIGKQHCRS